MKIQLRSQDVPTSAASVGRESFARKSAPKEKIIPSDVSFVRPEDQVRFFHTGTLVGLWRSLRSQRVLGSSPSHPELFAIEPDWSGKIVPEKDSAASWAETQSELGFWVISPIFLAYDTSLPRYLWKSRDPGPAQGTEAFVVILAPFAKKLIQELANDPESGG